MGVSPSQGTFHLEKKKWTQVGRPYRQRGDPTWRYWGLHYVDTKEASSLWDKKEEGVGNRRGEEKILSRGMSTNGKKIDVR